MPVIAFAARLIILKPTNLLTKGIERDALTFASITDTSSSFTRYWMLNGPLTLRALPILAV